MNESSALCIGSMSSLPNNWNMLLIIPAGCDFRKISREISFR
jgi:hypothetical protein